MSQAKTQAKAAFSAPGGAHDDDWGSSSATRPNTSDNNANSWSNSIVFNPNANSSSSSSSSKANSIDTWSNDHFSNANSDELMFNPNKPSPSPNSSSSSSSQHFKPNQNKWSPSDPGAFTNGAQSHNSSLEQQQRNAGQFNSISSNGNDLNVGESAWSPFSSSSINTAVNSTGLGNYYYYYSSYTFNLF